MSQGKWVEISFDERTRICGAHIDSYLLEKTRVVQQASEERNYHIFYELIAGATDEERRELELGDAKEFKVRCGWGVGGALWWALVWSFGAAVAV